MTAHAAWEGETCDLAQAFGIPDGVVDRRRTQLSREGQEAIGIAVRSVGAGADECQDPPAPSIGNVMAPRLLMHGSGNTSTILLSSGRFRGVVDTAVE